MSTLTELKNQIYLLKQALDLLPGNVYIKDILGHYLFCNTHYINELIKAQIIHDVQEIIGKTDEDLFELKTAKAFRKQDQEVMKTK